MKKQLAVVAFLAGAGAAAMNGAAQASADPLPPPAPFAVAPDVPHGPSVRDRVLETAQREFARQNPGTYYSEGARQAWCANFVSWVMRESGDPLTNVRDGRWRVPGVYTLMETFASENKLEPVGYRPSPGDVVLYGGSGHTNIVVGVDGDRITTIGGNEGNRISQRTISRFSGNIMGFGRLDDEPAAVELPLPPPMDPFAPPPAPEFVNVSATSGAEPEFVDPMLPPPPAPEFVAPPAPEFVAPPAPEVVSASFTPPMDPMLPPPPPPAPEFVPVGMDAPPPPFDPFAPPPAAPEFAPEFVPAAVEVPPPPMDPMLPPPPAPESFPLSAPDAGVPHLSAEGALPGPAV